MTLLLYGVGILTLATLVLALLGDGVLRLLRCRPRRYWRGALLVCLALVPVHALLLVPLGMAWFVVRGTHTRGDEAGYRGPRIAADGHWELQSRASLASEGKGNGVESPFAVRFTSADGVGLRGFLVPPRGAPRLPTVVLAHGLFRGALEIEGVAAMFRELGSEVLLVELRSHGASEKRPLGFGRAESRDVLAAVAFLRARAGHADDPVILYGVSLGAAATLLAAPQVEHLAALCVDAPMDDAIATGHRMLDLAPKEGHRRFSIPQPFRSLLLWSAEVWSEGSLAAVRPIDAARALPKDLPVLVVGGGEDQRMPPDVVRSVFLALPMTEPVKTLWIREGSDHGAVFVDDPAGYRKRLEELVARLRAN